MNENMKQMEVGTIKQMKEAGSKQRPWFLGSTSLPSATTTRAGCTESGSTRPSIPRNWLNRYRTC